MTDYFSINKKLFDLNFSKQSRLDLTHVQKLYNALELKSFPKIHVAGTNGKGSCVKKLSEALSLSGYQCGSFFSPHIATFRERIQINGQMISKEAAAQVGAEILNLSEKMAIEITFFEATFLMAMKYFSQKQVDAAVIEVGLGGRLDATNCIIPILSIITSISLDHVQILGDTLEKIAFEKAGIIKPHIPLITGPKANQSSIEKMAQANFSQHIKVSDQEFESYDQENQAIAKEGMSFLKKYFSLSDLAIKQALPAKPPVRYEKIFYQQHELILDMSHNEDGLRRLFSQITIEYPHRPKIVFTSAAANHDYKTNLAIIKKHVEKIYILDILHPRLAKAEDLLAAIESGGFICQISEIPQILQSQTENPLIIVTGSIFIMKEIYTLIGKEQDCDVYQIQDGLFKSPSHV